jgi:hypothetical protein
VTEEHPPSGERSSAGNSLLYGVPLTLFPFLVYLVLAWTGWVGDWAQTVVTITLPSGGVMSLGFGDLLILFGLVCLFCEVLKSTRAGSGSFLDLVASTAVFVAAIVCIAVFPIAATAPFLVLIAITLFDVISSVSAARRRSLQKVVRALT